MDSLNRGEGKPDTEADIMEATYRALCKHGYSDLTIQRIGDEFEKSKSLLYHHYEGKDELLLDFLSSMLEEFEQGFECCKSDSNHPEKSLATVLDHSLDPVPDEEHFDFGQAMVELRAQAAHDMDYQEYFTKSDAVFCNQLTSIVADGVTDGIFRDVDPACAAEHIHTIIVGTMTRRATADDVDVEAIRNEVDEYVTRRLKAVES